MAQLAKTVKPSELAVSLVFDEMAIKKHLDYSQALDRIDGLMAKGEVANQSRGIDDWRSELISFILYCLEQLNTTDTVHLKGYYGKDTYGLILWNDYCVFRTNNCKHFHLLSAGHRIFPGQSYSLCRRDSRNTVRGCEASKQDWFHSKSE